MSLPPAPGTPPGERRYGYATMYVSREVVALGGSVMRREIRRQMRLSLVAMAGVEPDRVRIRRFRFNPWERDGDMDAPMSGESTYVLTAYAVVEGS